MTRRTIWREHRWQNATSPAERGRFHLHGEVDVQAVLLAVIRKMLVFQLVKTLLVLDFYPTFLPKQSTLLLLI
jgi:hypothetical protein